MFAKQKARTLCARLSHGFGTNVSAAALAAILASSTQAQDHILGRWDPPLLGYDWPLVNAKHTIHLPTGKILVAKNGTKAYLWDPSDGSFTPVPVPNAAHNIACSGHTGLADGSVLAAGGRDGDFATNKTSIYSSTQSGSSGPWRQVGEMNFTRWYPTCITLPDEKVLAIGGTIDPQDEPGVPFVDQPEIYDPVTELWGGSLPIQPADTLRTYPFMFVLPDSDVFFAGPGNNTFTLDIVTGLWTAADSSWPHVATRGSAVMFEPGWVLKSGGTFSGNFAQNLTSWIDLNVPSETNGEWVLVDEMEYEKERHNLVMLPVGKILAIGGQFDLDPDPEVENWIPIMAAEWFDPDDLIPIWEELAEMVRPRGHHSTAMLLGDGRVLACGGDDHFDPYEFGTSQSAEIFSPPYLFVDGGGKAPRPLIGFAPTAVTYGTHFSVILSRGSPVPREGIEKVTFVRLGAVTHSFNMDQRYLSLAVQTDPSQENGLIVEAPADGNLAPPGYYMLFLISVDGAPSIAKYVQLIPPPSP